MKARRRISATAVRLGASLAAVLALFAIALVVVLGTLRRIGEAEAEVETLDHAKHTGHLAAALVREQYIHQAHTIIVGDSSHLDHYEDVASETRRRTELLRTLATTAEERARADEIARLARQNDDEFRSAILPAIARQDRGAVNALHERTESLVNRVVRLNEELNGMFEQRSGVARTRARALRIRARTVTVVCFGLAIGLAAAVGVLLMRSILRPVAKLREGAERVGAGDLAAQIEIGGRDEFAQLAGTFNQMTADLRRHQQELVRSQKLASVGQLAAGVAHEINNPLGVILGYLKLLRRDPALAGHEELKIIEDEAVQCQRIVQGLLELARPPRLEIMSVDLAQLARDAVERLEESGQLDGLRIELPPPASSALARADEAQIRQVILNLVLNAAEAARDSGAPPHVSIEVGSTNGHTVLRVSDSGPGIPPDVLPHVFDPFFTTKKGGTGLGLAIAQAIVDAHGGALEVESGSARGTRIALRLPAASGEES